MLSTEAPGVYELALHGSTTKEIGVVAMVSSTTRDADEVVHMSSSFEGCGSRFVRSCSSASVTTTCDSGVVTTVLDCRAIVASGLVTTVLDEVFLFFLVFTSDRASRFS